MSPLVTVWKFLHRALFAAALVLCASAPAEASDPRAHLERGALGFKGGDFESALVEFKIAERLRSVEATWYLGATLVKLERHEEAIETFARAQAAAPELRDGLFDYYHAVACYEARLYLCADALLERVGEAGGPRIREQAAALRSGIRELLEGDIPASAIDTYLTKGDRALEAKRPHLARAHYAEALELTLRHIPPHRESDARTKLDAAETAIRRGRTGGSR